MKVVASIEAIREVRNGFPGSVGFVPTMGFLHEGHLSLVREAKKECEHVVVSIFVNPTQFGPNEDLATYPRNLDTDLALLAEEDVDLVWTPEEGDLYPDGFKTYVDVEKLGVVFEGAARPGHFRGVATVVAKLFLAVQPDRAYFGQKDAQQVAVLTTMTCDLNFPVELVICPTRREPDGLAMSSRNSYLSAEERRAAAVLYRGLQAAKQAYMLGETNASNLVREIRNVIAQEPLANIDYIACIDKDTFDKIDTITAGATLILAAYVGNTRLIDNLPLM